MIALARSLPRPYAIIGAALLFLALMVVGAGLRGYMPDLPIDGFVWQVVTGVPLLALIGYQWMLLFARVGKDAQATRVHYRWHRWSGIAIMALYLFHAVRFGYAWTSALSIVFLLSAATGLLNREVIAYRSQALYRLWYTTHLAVSAILLPLALLHVWVALAYE